MPKHYIEKLDECTKCCLRFIDGQCPQCGERQLFAFEIQEIATYTVMARDHQHALDRFEDEPITQWPCEVHQREVDYANKT